MSHRKFILFFIIACLGVCSSFSGEAEIFGDVKVSFRAWDECKPVQPEKDLKYLYVEPLGKWQSQPASSWYFIFSGYLESPEKSIVFTQTGSAFDDPRSIPLKKSFSDIDPGGKRDLYFCIIYFYKSEYNNVNIRRELLSLLKHCVEGTWTAKQAREVLFSKIITPYSVNYKEWIFKNK